MALSDKKTGCAPHKSIWDAGSSLPSSSCNEKLPVLSTENSVEREISRQQSYMCHSGKPTPPCTLGFGFRGSFVTCDLQYIRALGTTPIGSTLPCVPDGLSGCTVQVVSTLRNWLKLASSPGLLRLSGVACHVHPVDPRGIAHVCVAH